MKTLLPLIALLLAACGADGPPTPPPPKDAVVTVPAEPITTSVDRTGDDTDLSRPADAATATEEF